MTFAERSRGVAAGFLQTVIIIDDLARFRSVTAEGPAQTAQEAKPGPDAAAVTPDGLKDGLKLKEPSKEQMKAAADEGADSDDLDVKAVSDGFAARGLVCAVIRPDPGESLKLAQAAAFKKADIVVLDWVLHKDYGDIAVQIISSLLSSDSDRLRLIAIYTGDHDLRQIADRVAKAVDEHFPGSTMMRPDAFTVHKGPVRVVVYAKPKTRIPQEDAEATARVTAWAILPDSLISDFAVMTSGLVSDVAMASLSALRNNTHRVLRRLSQPLDAAYLWHRATQVDPLDAEEHLKIIVVEEVASILDDEGVEASADIAAIEDWLTERVPQADYRARFGLATDATRQDAVNLLTHGTVVKTPESEAAKTKFNVLARSPHKKTDQHQCFAGSVDDNKTAQENFAALLSIKTHYSSPKPILTQGTLLRHTAAGGVAYWVCVQPICDSVRLAGATAFPVLPLSVDQERFHVVLTQAGAQTLRLRLDAKPLHLHMVTFTPNTGPRGAVGAERNDGLWYFKDADGAQYEWLAELRPHQALRMADILSSELRRVGLVESEWLRLWSSL